MIALLRRLAIAPLVVLAASFIVFSMMKLLPGDPVTLMLGDRANDPALATRMRRELGLDRSLGVQYGNFLAGALRGDLGRSYRTGRSVTQDVLAAMPATLELTMMAVLMGFSLGIPAGVLAAFRRGRLTDTTVTTTTVAAMAIPTFWLGLLLAWTFGYRWPILDSAGRTSDEFSEYVSRTGFLTLDALITRDIALLRDALRHLLLPATTLAVGLAAVMARVTRAATLDALAEPCLRTARAKGLGPLGIAHHTLRQAVVPLLAIGGLQIAYLVGGAMVTEEIFAWPGLGTYLIQSIRFRDYPCVVGAVMTVTLLVIVVNLAADTMAEILDPRSRRAAA